MITLNNPLVIFAGKLLGVGVELRLDHVDGVWKLCFELQVIAWAYCKEWRRVG